ncbi:hypothetical protein AM499_06875 [Bacillus sp. FJAT-22090]|uniref:hypothetical protein n=1 Tax=Bacillus sp. FJAT-22090 TaxID=1581038 RepID=UPI0006B01F2C|nr:hypothetical protein [Bacillus sp. FJAT-22090]ALC85574.1 hypothetical protein AM499_06875 [Bacillus sp. FJAT-22090]
MEMTIEELIKHRIKEKCYFIENTDENYFVISGSYCKEVVNGELYNTLSLFLKEDTNRQWKYVQHTINHDRDNGLEEGSKSKWIHLYDVDKKRVIDVSTLYIDGIKKI